MFCICTAILKAAHETGSVFRIGIQRREQAMLHGSGGRGGTGAGVGGWRWGDSRVRGVGGILTLVVAPSCGDCGDAGCFDLGSEDEGGIGFSFGGDASDDLTIAVAPSFGDCNGGSRGRVGGGEYGSGFSIFGLVVVGLLGQVSPTLLFEVAGSSEGGGAGNGALA